MFLIVFNFFNDNMFFGGFLLNFPIQKFPVLKFIVYKVFKINLLCSLFLMFSQGIVVNLRCCFLNWTMNMALKTYTFTLRPFSRRRDGIWPPTFKSLPERF